MSFKLQDAVWSINLPHAEKAVLGVLCRFANEDGAAWPSIETLCGLSGFTRRAVQEALRSLEERRYIEAIRGGGRSSTTRYHVLIPDAAVCAAVANPAKLTQGRDPKTGEPITLVYWKQRSQCADMQEVQSSAASAPFVETAQPVRSLAETAQPLPETAQPVARNSAASAPESVIESVSESVSEDGRKEGRLDRLRPVLKRVKAAWEQFYADMAAKHPTGRKYFEQESARLQTFAAKDYELLDALLKDESADDLLARWEKFIEQKEREDGWSEVKHQFRVFANQV